MTIGPVGDGAQAIATVAAAVAVVGVILVDLFDLVEWRDPVLDGFWLPLLFRLWLRRLDRSLSPKKRLNSTWRHGAHAQIMARSPSVLPAMLALNAFQVASALGCAARTRYMRRKVQGITTLLGQEC